MRSRESYHTYIIDTPHSLPVINITVNDDDLYDHHSGIYADGPGYTTPFPHKGANYWKGWWKKAHVEFYDSVSKGFSENCELAIFGGFSRALAKKSFKIRFKNNSNSPSVVCDLFATGKPEEYKKFVLRSGSQDVSGVMVRDEFFTSLMQQHSPNLLIQQYRPVALYINAEYFGLYYIREKIDKNFVARKLNVSNDSITIMMAGKYCEQGSKAKYFDFMNFVGSHDLSLPQNYDYVKKNFDVEALIDFKLGEMYSCNLDLGNVRYVRSDDKKSDGKWHIVFYDLDATWQKDADWSLYFSIGQFANSMYNPNNRLVVELLKNPDFRRLFMERLSMHMHSTFTTANTQKTFDDLINTIKPEMERNCERWPNVLSYTSWLAKVEKFRAKFATRNKIMLNNLRNGLEITPEENKKYFADLGF